MFENSQWRLKDLQLDDHSTTHTLFFTDSEYIA